MGRMGKCKAMQKCFLFFSVLVFAKTVAAVASVFHLQPTGNGLLPRSDGVGKGTQSLYEFVISHMHEALIWWIKVHSKAQCRGNSTLVTTLYNCIYCIYIYTSVRPERLLGCNVSRLLSVHAKGYAM